ncbi:carbamoyltransferase C-terminal domain-containing protein [Streptomyces goshikiensis]|uniref:carbamoyltransferase C-terminal domain-containing protein n=1 Tax=Streptomyces goshikiensis TaxID=1942 RepID=UPI003678F925
MPRQGCGGVAEQSRGASAQDGRLPAPRGVEELFVQPAAGNAGCAIGAALEAARRRGDLTLPGPAMTTAALGPAFTPGPIRSALDDLGLPYRDLGDDLVTAAAGHLAPGRGIGWFQGRMEAGPRALGRRSILADAHDPRSRDHINDCGKNREPWRPLAPALLEEAAPDQIGTAAPHPFMIVARPATESARHLIPAAVHIDDTPRPQPVARDDNDAALLASFAEQTGRDGPGARAGAMLEEAGSRSSTSPPAAPPRSRPASGPPTVPCCASTPPPPRCRSAPCPTKSAPALPGPRPYSSATTGAASPPTRSSDRPSPTRPPAASWCGTRTPRARCRGRPCCSERG